VAAAAGAQPPWQAAAAVEAVALLRVQEPEGPQGPQQQEALRAVGREPEPEPEPLEPWAAAEAG